MAKIIGRERAILLAQLASRVHAYNFYYFGEVDGVGKSVEQAENLLKAAEELVATTYGEFR